MGKFRVRVSAKGQRWKKGQSSNSNPSTFKFRDAAKNGFFLPLPGDSKLTKEALKLHDNNSSFKADEVVDDEDAISFGSQTYKTFDTFASDWSQCSNKSFSHLLRHFRANNAFHKELLAVLAAIAEVIKENGGTESSTEYFAALMTSLDSTDEDENSLHAIITLLSMCIKSVPQSVLRSKFPQSSKILMQLLAKHASSDSAVSILRPITGCISVLLRNQEAASWSDPYTLQVLDSIICFVTYSKPKVRKAAQHGVLSVVLKSEITSQGLAMIAERCTTLVESLTSGGVTATLHALTLLKDIMHAFPKKEIKRCIEAVLKVMTMNNTLVTSCGLRALHGMLSNGAKGLPSSRAASLLTALYDYQPPPNDAQPTQAWLATMHQAYVFIAKNDKRLALSSLSKLLKTCTTLYLTEKIEVMSATTHSLDAIIESTFSEDENPNQNLIAAAGALATHLSDCLAYQYHASWSHILHLFATLFKSCNSSYRDTLVGSLKTLGNLRDSNQFAFNNEIDAAVGHAVAALGPETILSAIPFQIVADDGKHDFKRSWLLPILKDNIKVSTLKYFTDNFIPRAMLCKTEAEKLKAEKNHIASLSYDLLQSQIWALLPSFCNAPTDINSTFPSIAKALGGTLSGRPELRMSVLTALRKLILHCPEGSDDLATLARFGKNFLPILFTIYTTPAKGSDEEGIKLSTYETVKVYLKITDETVCTELFQKAFQKLFEPDIDNDKRSSVLDLLRALVPYQSRNELEKLFKLLTDNITEVPDHKQQKKYFRLLEDMCTAESESCKELVTENLDTIKDLLMSSLSTSAPSSKGARLRCMLELVKNWSNPSELLMSILPETILCVKDVNAKCRETAYKLITEAAEKSEDPGPVVETVMMGFTGSQSAISCSVLALTPLIYHYKERIPRDLEEQILYNISLLSVCSSREIVNACLSFIKVYIQTYPRNKIATFVPSLMKLLSTMSDDVKRSCRTKVRDLLARLIRWFGSEPILSSIPGDDNILRTRVRNLGKIISRRKKTKESEKGDDDKMETDEFLLPAKHKTIDEILAESDSDLDFDDEEDKSKGKKKSREGKAWITERVGDIVDFTDPSTAKKISTSKPDEKTNQPAGFVKKKAKSNFATAPDGRLIIKDNESDDEGTYKKKPFVIPGLEDSDDDYVASDDEGKTVKSFDAKSMKSSTSTHASKFLQKAGSTSSKYVAGGSGIHRPVGTGQEGQKKKKSKKGENKGPTPQLGKEFKSKKSKGDVKKKGLPDPYAYLPLRTDTLNKRKRLKAMGQIKSFVQSARRGAAAGAKQKMKKMKMKKR